MARLERVHDRIAAVSSELSGTVGVVARDLASPASVCVNADERWGLDESCGYDGTLAIDQALNGPGAPLVAVVYCNGLSYRAKERASGIAAGLYKRLGEPA